MNKTLFASLLTLLLLAACAAPQAAPLPAATEPPATQAPAATEPPTATEPPVPTPVPPTATPENQIFRDDFSGSLQPGWTWEFEIPELWTITDDGWLQIQAGDGSLFVNESQSNLLWRGLPEGDFTIVTHVQANPTENFQQASIFLYEDKDNYLTINRGYCQPCGPRGNAIYMDYMIDGQIKGYNQPLQDTDVYLKLESVGQTISGYYAVQPGQWQRVGRFGNYFTFTQVGLGVSNADPQGTGATDLVGLYDYFEITKAGT